MVRTVKTKATRSLKKGETALLLPGPTGAEPWELWLLGGATAAECVQTCATPLENRLRKNTTLALPVSQVFCVPLWLNETDPKQLAAMIPLQLELRGLQPRGNGAPIFDWSVVIREEKRTLVTVGVLPSLLPEELHVETYEIFDLSARCLPLPENSLVLWQEQDRLVVAITTGPHLVYFQTLAEGRITPRVLQDLNCIRATLAMQDIVTSTQQVMLWTEVSPAELVDLQTALRLPARQATRPSPRTSAPAWKLTPAPVTEAKKAREARRWQSRALLIFLVVYAAVLVLLATRYVITSRKVDELARWQTANAPALTAMRETRAIWRELRPVVDENSYPLELLRNLQASIPTDQLNLTLFQADDGHLLVKGEAKNVAAAYQFLDNIKKDPHFAGYTWTMTQPTVSTNDLAKLQIEGTLSASDDGPLTP